MLAISTPAAAFELFGITLFAEQADRDSAAVIADPQAYAATLTVTGAAEAESAIRGASSLISDQAEPASGAAGLIAKARGDYRRIVAALYSQGYYGGTVSVRIDGREASTVPPDAALSDPAQVTIAVDPGPLFRFGRMTIANPAPSTSDPADVVEAPAELGFAAGEIARSGIIATAEARLIEAWRQQGYPKAEIADRQVVADHATATVDVAITVAPGPHAGIGAVSVTGTTNMNPDFVATQTGLVPGEEYDPDTIARAQERLSRLEVFRAQRLEAASAIGSDGLLPYTVIVEELSLNRVGAGATFSTTDGLGLEAFYLQRNLFGQAERLRLDAKLAGIGFPIDTAEFDYAFGGTFTKPGIWGPDTDLVAAISAERTVLPSFTETSAAGRLGVTSLLSNQLTLDAATTYELAMFDDDFGNRTFSTAGIRAGLTFDNRDDSQNATEGFYANVSAEPFYEFNYGNPGLQATVEGRGYFSFDEDAFFVLAGRFKAGVLVGPGLDEIPPDRLFFAGGGGSVRGYGFKSIGVPGPGDIITGGRYLLEASAEARVKVTKDIGIVGFVDGGVVAADSFPGVEDLRIGAGAGLRYYTPLGPLRLDVAVPLNKHAGDPDYALYVGIGQAF